MTGVPIIAAKTPVKVELEEGKRYFWCQCGRSKSQPFCDGSHKGLDIEPISFIAEKSGAAFLCQCKASSNAPFCDSTHTSLDDLNSGDPVPDTGQTD